MLRHEIRRAFRSGEFWIAIGIGIILMGLHYFEVILPSVQYIDESIREGLLPHSVFNKWIGASASSLISMLYFMLLPILAALPYGASYFQDRKSGYLQQMVLKKGKKKYLLSKYTAIFLAGGSAVTIPLLVELYAAAMTLPSIIPVMAAGYFPWQHGTRLMPYLPFEDPYVYVMIYLMIIFVFSGALAGICAAIAPVSRNTFVVLITPFVLVRFVGSIATFLGAGRFDPLQFLNPIQYADRISWMSLLFCFLVIWLPSFGIYLWKGLHDDIF